MQQGQALVRCGESDFYSAVIIILAELYESVNMFVDKNDNFMGLIKIQENHDLDEQKCKKIIA